MFSRQCNFHLWEVVEAVIRPSLYDEDALLLKIGAEVAHQILTYEVASKTIS